MRLQPIALGLVVLASGATGAGQFEGTIDIRVISERNVRPAAIATQRMYVSALGSRSEPVRDGHRPSKIAILRLKAAPELVYRISETRKTYRLASAQGDAEISRENFTVKRLGRAMQAGYRCEHIMLTGDRGTVFEQWIAPAIRGLEHWISEGQRVQGVRVMPSGVNGHEVDGMPVKVILRSSNAAVVSWQVTRIDRRRVPASFFDIAGYQEGAVRAISQGRDILGVLSTPSRRWLLGG